MPPAETDSAHQRGELTGSCGGGARIWKRPEHPETIRAAPTNGRQGHAGPVDPRPTGLQVPALEPQYHWVAQEPGTDCTERRWG